MTTTEEPTSTKRYGYWDAVKEIGWLILALPGTGLYYLLFGLRRSRGLLNGTDDPIFHIIVNVVIVLPVIIFLTGLLLHALVKRGRQAQELPPQQYGPGQTF